MPRTIGTSLLARLQAPVLMPRWLVEIAGTYRWASGADRAGEAISWGGYTWAPRVIDVPSLQIDQGYLRGAEILASIHADEVATFAALTDSSTIKVYLTDGGLSTFASDDAIELYNGKLTGGFVLEDLDWRASIRAGVQARYPVGAATYRAGFTHATPPGTYRYLGGTYTLTLRRE